jgi:hypothetical protein
LVDAWAAYHVSETRHLDSQPASTEPTCYGGAIENRARLLMEVVEAVSDVWGQHRVGVRLSPLGTFNDMGDDGPETTLATSSIAAEKGIGPDPGALRMLELIRERYRGTLIIAGGCDHDTAEGRLLQGKADLIAFGRKVLANPDLPERVRSGASLNDLTTYYGGGAIGYTDYPSLARELARNRTLALTKGGDNVLPETFQVLRSSPTGTVSCREPGADCRAGEDRDTGHALAIIAAFSQRSA